MVGMTMQATNEITVYEPNYKFAFKGSSPFPSYESETFTRNGSDTQIDYEGVFHSEGLYRVFEPLLHWMLKRQVTASFTRLKKLLESQDAVRPVNTGKLRCI
jgi:hypothetical protein